MTDRPILQPGPGHTIAIEPAGERVDVSRWACWNTLGSKITASTRAMRPISALRWAGRVAATQSGRTTYHFRRSQR